MLKNITKAVFAVAIILSNVSANAADCTDPKAFVTSVKDDVLNVLNSQASDEEKRAKLDAAFRNTADTAWMSKFVLGRNYSKLTSEQQTQYAGVYTDYLSASYVNRFKEYNGEAVVINSIKPVNDDFNVETTIQRKDKAPVTITYRVRKAAECYKIADIVAEGVSLINTQRQDFGSAYNSRGYDGLVELLKTKTEQLKSSK